MVNQIRLLRRTYDQPTSERGFTLLEVLIALSILAIAAAGLITASSQSLRQQRALEDKTFALLVAQNRISELRAARAWPSKGSSYEIVAMAGKNWQLRTALSATTRPDMLEITADVFLPNANMQGLPFFTLTGFLGKY